MPGALPALQAVYLESILRATASPDGLSRHGEQDEPKEPQEQLDLLLSLLRVARGTSCSRDIAGLELHLELLLSGGIYRSGSVPGHALLTAVGELVAAEGTWLLSEAWG